MIGGVLLLGLLLSLLRSDWTRPVAIGAQGFALLGTIVGLVTIAIGVGPRTVPDLVYHLLIIAALAWGLAVAWRS